MKYYPHWMLRSRYLNKGLRIANLLYRLFLRFRLQPCRAKLERLGSDYGGWFVPVEKINANWIVYSAGIGRDITFDGELMSRFGCKVYAFDPTPGTIQFIAEERGRRKELDKFLFFPIGLFNRNTKLRFYAPKTRGWIGSYSIHNLQGSESYFEAECKTLPTIVSELGHSKIHLLKMDIEGAECEVLENVLEDRIDIDWLCVEFDQPVPFWTTHRILSLLNDAGFLLQKIDRWNFTFAHQRVV